MKYRTPHLATNLAPLPHHGSATRKLFPYPTPCLLWYELTLTFGVLACGQSSQMILQSARPHWFKLADGAYPCLLEGQDQSRTCAARSTACSTCVLTRVRHASSCGRAACGESTAGGVEVLEVRRAGAGSTTRPGWEHDRPDGGQIGRTGDRRVSECVRAMNGPYGAICVLGHFR